MYISVETPRHSTRGHRDDDGQAWMIFAGPSFTHGHVDEERESFADLERFAADHFGVTADYRWTNEDYTPMDHAPFIGWSSALRDGYLVATGFNAWGITNGTAAAILIADLIAGARQSLAEAVRRDPDQARRRRQRVRRRNRRHVAAHLVGGYLSSQAAKLRRARPGRGGGAEGGRAQCRRLSRRAGRGPRVSAVCTHMGCLVGWNETDRTWDCPCHGSRFALDGTVIHGPAVQPLAPHRAE